MTRVPFVFVQPAVGWESMTEEELAKWVTEQINSPLEAMELPDEQDEGERA